MQKIIYFLLIGLPFISEGPHFQTKQDIEDEAIKKMFHDPNRALELLTILEDTPNDTTNSNSEAVNLQLKHYALIELGKFDEALKLLKRSIDLTNPNKTQYRGLQLQQLRLAFLWGNKPLVESTMKDYSINKDTLEKTAALTQLKQDHFLGITFYDLEIDACESITNNLITDKTLKDQLPQNQLVSYLNAAKLYKHFDNQPMALKMLKGLDSLIIKYPDLLKKDCLKFRNQIAIVLDQHEDAFQLSEQNQKVMLENERLKSFLVDAYYSIRSLQSLGDQKKLRQHAQEVLTVAEKADALFWINYSRLAIAESYLLENEIAACQRELNKLLSIELDFKLNVRKFELISSICNNSQADFDQSHIYSSQILTKEEHTKVDKLAVSLGLEISSEHIQSLEEEQERALMTKWAIRTLLPKNENKKGLADGNYESPLSVSAVTILVLSLILLILSIYFLVFFLRKREPIAEKPYEGDKKNKEKVYELSIDQRLIRLKQEFPELTSMDLVYVKYSLLNKKNFEIMADLNISQSALHKGRYRLKKRLNLRKDEKLDAFLNAKY